MMNLSGRFTNQQSRPIPNKITGSTIKVAGIIREDNNDTTKPAKMLTDMTKLTQLSDVLLCETTVTSLIIVFELKHRKADACNQLILAWVVLFSRQRSRNRHSRIASILAQ
jgi:hypothetical protein